MARKKQGMDGLNSEDIKLAKSIFAVKYPNFAVKLDDSSMVYQVIKELLAQESFRLGLDLNLEQKQDRQPIICQLILKLTGLLSAYVSQENRTIYADKQIEIEMQKIANMNPDDLAAKIEAN
jgi:hypothetical protein